LRARRFRESVKITKSKHEIRKLVLIGTD